MDKQIVLITGGAGFLGQHLVRVMQDKSEDIKEIRIVDLVKYRKKMNYDEKIPVMSFCYDVALMITECKETFKNVTTVFHCAAQVTYEFPPNDADLNWNNVEGTKRVIEACLEYGVKSLIYTSSTEVCIKPYFNNGFFCIIVNQSESRELPPERASQLLFGAYASSKLRAEELILSVDNEKHNSGEGRLRTTSLRPPFMYGEEDNGIFKNLIEIGKQRGLWKIGGPGGKHQFVYAGNVAWAHLKAKEVLESQGDSVGGLPVFVLDDTCLLDLLKFCEILTEKEGEPIVKRTNWAAPSLLSFLIFFVFEMVYKLLFNFIDLRRLPFSPKSLVVYLGSAIFFNRLRAILHLDYTPPFSPSEALNRSKQYYNSYQKEYNDSKDCK